MTDEAQNLQASETQSTYVSPYGEELIEGFRCRTYKNRIKEVLPPWSPAQWFAVLDREGQALGTCCAQISAARDCLIAAIPDGGWIDGESLAKIMYLLGTHDGFEGFSTDPHNFCRDNPGNPLNDLAVLWPLVRTRLREADAPVARGTDTPVTDAWRILSNISTAMWYQGMFSGSGGDPERAASDKLLCDFCVAKVLPALQTLWASLPQYFSNGPVTAYAVVNKSSPEEILSLRRGAAIFHSLDQLQQTAEIWRASSESIENLGYRILQLSPEGAKFLGGEVAPLP